MYSSVKVGGGCWANEQINEETICTNKVHSESIIVSQHRT